MNTAPDQIVDAARKYSIAASTEVATELAEIAAAFASTLDIFEPDLPADKPARVVAEGNDPHNAFRYECVLETSDGSLAGLEVAVKDNLAVSGVPMTCGSESLAFVPSYHSTAVRRLADNGASVRGTTNMDDFAYFVTGETCAHGAVANPQVDGCVPGGSSAGSGAAVAADLVDAALGSDTGGSVRIPAAWCGVVGFKPTHRTVSRFGFADLSPTLDHIGVLASSMKTASRIVDVISGPDPWDPSTYPASRGQLATDGMDGDVDGLTLGLVKEAFAVSDPAVAETIDTVARALRSEGATIERRSLPGYEKAGQAVEVICGAEFVTLMSNGGQVFATGTGYSDEWRQAVEQLVANGEYGENVREQLVLNRVLLDATEGRSYVAAQNRRSRFIKTVDETFEDVDALITPTTPMTAPAFGEVQSVDDFLRTVANTGPFNLTGHPALSVPCGEVQDKPVGLQVVTDWHDEATATAVGSAIDR